MSKLKEYLDLIDTRRDNVSPHTLTIDADYVKQIYRQITHEASPSWRTAVLPPVPGNVFPNPSDIPQLMEHFASQIQYSKGALHPVELGAMAYKRIADMAPFNTHNEELAQAVMNELLSASGYPTLSTPLWGQKGYNAAISESRLKKDMDIFSEFTARTLSMSL